MICKTCGNEIPDNQPIPKECPVCKQPLEVENSDSTTETPAETNEQTDSETPSEESSEDKKTQNKTTPPPPPADSKEEKPDGESPKSGNNIIWAVLAVVVVLVIVILVLMMGKNGNAQGITAQLHANPTSAQFVTRNSVNYVVGNQSIKMYSNDALDLSSHNAIEQMLASSTPYIGGQNMVQFEDGNIAFISSSLTSVDPMTNQPTMTGNLYLQKAGASEPVELDKEVQVIYASNGNSMFYQKATDGKVVQYQYDNKTGTTTPVDEITGLENSIISDVSDDGTVFAVIQLSENGTVNQSGYLADGTPHLFEDKTVTYLSKDGKTVYAAMQNQYRMVDLFYVKDMATGELEQIGTNITEMLPYADDGSIAFVGDCDPTAGKSNPIGNIYIFDAATRQKTQLAENATAIMESFPRQMGWMNENGKELQTTENAASVYLDTLNQLYKGQVHYINANGDLAVNSPDTDELVIGQSMYDSEAYSYSSDVSFTTATKDYLFWLKGDVMYRYKLGSMEEPKSIQLDESINDKLANNQATQVGYIITGAGDILEESGDAIILKKFDSNETVTVLENVGTVAIVGIDNDGKTIYFISQDNSLYSKSIESRSNPKRLASNVYTAVITTEGLYYLQNYDDTKGGTLYHLPYDGNAVTIAADVLALNAQPIID